MAVGSRMGSFEPIGEGFLQSDGIVRIDEDVAPLSSFWCRVLGS